MNVHYAIYNLLAALTQKVNIMSLNFDKLAADVAAEKTVIESAVALLTTLATELRAVQAKLDAAIAAGDPAAIAAAQAQIDALATSVEANTSTLSTSVAANTVAAPTA